MSGPSIKSNVSLDNRVRWIEIVNSNLKAHLVAVNCTDNSFFAEQDLDTSRAGLGETCIEKGEQKRVEHHRPHHLAVNSKL